MFEKKYLRKFLGIRPCSRLSDLAVPLSMTFTEILRDDMCQIQAVSVFDERAHPTGAGIPSSHMASF